LKEHSLEKDVHQFNIGNDKKLRVDVPNIGQIREFTKKANNSSDDKSLDLMEEYFGNLGVSKKDFNDLSVSQMTAILKVINEVPK